MPRPAGPAAGTLRLQRLAGNRVATRALTAQRDISDLMKAGIAERRGRAMGMTASDADKEYFATDRFAASGGARATAEASALHPAKPNVAGLESTLEMRSRMGAVPTDTPGLGPAHSQAGNAILSQVATEKWASKRGERSAVELGQVGTVDVDRGLLDDKLSLNLNADVSNAQELAAEVEGRAIRNNRIALQSRLAEVRALALTAPQLAKLKQFESHLNATVQGTLSFRTESESLTNQLESVAAWFALDPVARDAQALKNQTAQFSDDMLTFFDAPGQTVRQVRIAMVAIAREAANRVKALSDLDRPDAAADQSIRTRLREQTVAWGPVSQTVSVGRVYQVRLEIANEWVRDQKMLPNVASTTARKDHTNKAALEVALQAALDLQRQPPPATWLKAVGFDMIHDLYMHSGIPAVSGCKVHSSVYKSEVAKLGKASWPVLSASKDAIVNYVLPTNLKLGFHVTLEGFPKFPGNRNGSPHYWRGGTEAAGNWAQRPASVPDDWAAVSTAMGKRLKGEVKRVGEAVEAVQTAGGIPGWPFATS